jgi:pimeloyl-ACP methyl ester carboxylesterase
LEQLQLLYKTSRINYLRFGSGPKSAFCFHGYGEEANSFSFLEKYAGDQYTFFAVDLPFHGHTQWNEGLTFTIDDLSEIIRLLISQVILDDGAVSEQRSTNNGQFSLIGFSLGGRVALSLYEKMPFQIEKLILLAPDGLKVNLWYWLSTQTWIGNKLFISTMKHPGWFFFVLKILNKLRLVNASVFKFINHYIGDEEARNILYQRWIVLRKVKPGLKKIKLLISKNNTPVYLIYGKHDRIILPVRGKKFIRGIERHCTLSVILSGHQVLHENHVREILPALLH